MKTDFTSVIVFDSAVDLRERNPFQKLMKCSEKSEIILKSHFVENFMDVHYLKKIRA